MAETLAIAACTFTAGRVAGFDEFAAHVRRVLDTARGAEVVLLPEAFTAELFTALPGWRERPIADLAEIDRFTADVHDLLTGEARERGQVIAGTHLERHGGVPRNVARLVTPDGVHHVHAKTHVVPPERLWGTQEGDSLAVVPLASAVVAFNVCYEIEFAACATRAADLGADLILCPSLTNSEAGFWRVRHCAAARAVEHQVYVAHACAGGDPGPPLAPGWAASSVLGPCDEGFPPDGVLAEGALGAEGAVHAVLDLALLRRCRESPAAPTRADRRRRAGLHHAWEREWDA